MNFGINLLKRSTMFLAAIVPALLLVGVLVGIYIDEGFMGILAIVAAIFSAFPLSILVFPVGISAFMFPNSEIKNLFTLGYIPYLVLFVLGNLVKDRRIFIVIYLGFIVLLMMNVAGCVHIITGFLGTVE